MQRFESGLLVGHVAENTTYKVKESVDDQTNGIVRVAFVVRFDRFRSEPRLYPSPMIVRRLRFRISA